MKRIRLKDQIKIIESCTANSCPCYECFVDTGDCQGELQPSCNLGATFELDRDGWRTVDGVFPNDCPLEDAVRPSMELTDEERTKILKFIEENKENIIDVPTLKRSYTAEPRPEGYIEHIPVNEAQVIIRMRLPLADK